MIALIAKLLEYGAKKIKPTTLIQKGKEIGIDVDKLKTGNSKLVKKVLNELGFKSKSGGVMKTIDTAAKVGAGGAAGAYGKSVYDRMNKGGMVKMKRGGSVKKRAKSSSKKSRGTGAAIKGTKFKGVF